jgi:hypothetical protein
VRKGWRLQNVLMYITIHYMSCPLPTPPQVGLTDATQYEHRVGRTGRAGKTGLALLLLDDDEARMLQMLGGFPLSPAGAASEITGGLTAEGAARGLPVPPALMRAYQAVAREGELKSSADKAFVATLGFLAGARARGGAGRLPGRGAAGTGRPVRWAGGALARSWGLGCAPPRPGDLVGPHTVCEPGGGGLMCRRRDESAPRFCLTSCCAPASGGAPKQPRRPQATSSAWAGQRRSLSRW